MRRAPVYAEYTRNAEKSGYASGLSAVSADGLDCHIPE